MTEIERIWERIRRNAGQKLHTINGLPFTYVAPGNFLRVTRDGDEINRSLSRTNSEKAINFMPAAGPGDLKGTAGVVVHLGDPHGSADSSIRMVGGCPHAATPGASRVTPALGTPAAPLIRWHRGTEVPTQPVQSPGRHRDVLGAQRLAQPSFTVRQSLRHAASPSPGGNELVAQLVAINLLDAYAYQAAFYAPGVMSAVIQGGHRGGVVQGADQS